MRSTMPAAIRVAAAITGSRLLPPPGVMAARMSRTPSSLPLAMACTSPATWTWWERRERSWGKLGRGEEVGVDEDETERS